MDDGHIDGIFIRIGQEQLNVSVSVVICCKDIFQNVALKGRTRVFEVQTGRLANHLELMRRGREGLLQVRTRDE